MDNHELLTSIFAEQLELTANCASDTTSTLVEAGETIANRLLAGNKLLCAGQNVQNIIAQLFCNYLINGHDQERPSLPAIHLRASNFGSNALSYTECFSKQIISLGQSGDVLFIFSNNTADQSIISAIDAASDKELNIIICTNNQELAVQTAEKHTIITLPPTSKVRSLELQLATIHCLCEVIDNEIFGGK